MTNRHFTNNETSPLIVGIGEFLWDLLPSGPSMGGAPANFACHAAALGADALLISRVGDDDDGRRLVDRLKAFGVRTAGVGVDPDHPTGTVAVELAADGLPRFDIRENVAWDHLEATPEMAEAVRQADAVCFGTLAQRSAGSAVAIRTLLENAGPGTLRVLDLNLRAAAFPAGIVAVSLHLADVVKVNEDELDLLSRHLGLRGDMRERLSILVERFRLHLAACTLGPRGCMLHTRDTWAGHPGYAVAARDTVGAGDAFLAAVTLGTLRNWPLDAIAGTANAVAAHVCASDGAVPPLPDALRDRFRSAAVLPAG